MYSNPVASRHQPRTTTGWTADTKSGQYTTTSQNGAFTTTSSQCLAQTVQSERILSSSIVGESMLGPMPQEETVQYIEVIMIIQLYNNSIIYFSLSRSL